MAPKKKPSKRVIKLARKYKVKISLKRGSKRFYKSEKLILKQIKKKMRKMCKRKIKLKKVRKVIKKPKSRRSRFGLSDDWYNKKDQILSLKTTFRYKNSSPYGKNDIYSNSWTAKFYLNQQGILTSIPYNGISKLDDSEKELLKDELLKNGKLISKTQYDKDVLEDKLEIISYVQRTLFRNRSEYEQLVASVKFPTMYHTNHLFPTFLKNHPQTLEEFMETDEAKKNYGDLKLYSRYFNKELLTNSD
jgi:hypothetical protein